MAGPGCLTDWGPPNSCNNWDVVLWLAADRDALLCGTDCSDAWRKYSISNMHNSLVGTGQPRFTAEINTTRMQSSAYTHMHLVDGGSAAVLLYQLATPGVCPFNASSAGCTQTSGTSSLWAMKLRLGGSADSDTERRQSKSDDDPAQVSWRVAPPTSKVGLNATLDGFGERVDLALMRDECEHRQVLLRPSAGLELLDISATVEGDVGMLHWSFRQVGYVLCEACHNYRDSGGGWRPDVLLEPSSLGVIPLVRSDTTQSLWVEACADKATPSGNATGKLVIRGSSRENSDSPSDPFSIVVDVSIEVWELSMPALGHPDSMATSFCFWGDSHDGVGGLANYYENYYNGSLIQRRFYDFLAEHRLPADEIYVGSPRPVSEVRQLAEEGVPVITLLDATCACIGGASCICQKNSSLSDVYIDEVISILSRAIAQLNSSSALPDAASGQTLRVYGFDEASPERATAMRQLFGAIERRWPWVRKMATVAWDVPGDMPLETWVTSFSNYLAPGTLAHKQASRRAFEEGSQGVSRETWWYFCNGQGCPHSLNPECNGAVWPNPSFIEWPGIEARVVFWLASLHAIPGMLFWSNSYWASQCPQLRPCAPVRRINGTGMVDWDPRTSPATAPGQSYNGDGYFI